MAELERELERERELEQEREQERERERELEPMIYLVHENFKDVFIESIAVVKHTAEYRDLEVRWWNQGFMKQPWPISMRTQVIRIQESDLSRWKEFDPIEDTHPGRK